MTKQPTGDDGATFADMLEDHALRMATAQANVDPMLISIARETAAELLADYLDHVRLNRAARQVIARLGGKVVAN